MERRRLIILTKSPMHKMIGERLISGVCVVGMDPDTGETVRLVQAPEGGPLHGDYVRDFSVLDEIEVDTFQKDPEPPQFENRMIFADSIRRMGRTRHQLEKISSLWLQGQSASFMTDAKPWMIQVHEYDHSVELVKVENLSLVWWPDKKRPKATFLLNGQEHIGLRVTDPQWEIDPPAAEKKQEIIPSAWLVVSIPTIPYEKDGRYYKFVAAIYREVTSNHKNITKPQNDMAMEAKEVLKNIFGYDSFRAGQEETITALLAGKDVHCVMPTGQGKSFCYQIPAKILPGITLVISPLIALMKDQVEALIRNGIPAAYLNSSLSEAQQEMVMKKSSSGEYKLLYVAPERLVTGRFRSFCNSVQISLIAVDEAHCVSQWGPNFRYDYLSIDRFIESLMKRPPVVALTATATPRVSEDICARLKLKDPLIVRTGFDRPNLRYAVYHPKDRRTWLLDYLTKHPGKSGIIYCSTRNTTEEVQTFLERNGFTAVRYHAGLTSEERKKNQELFSFDQVPLVVATNAFGMGIDKPNVSFVIHYNIPKSMESYYQEAGRAGRDGEPADCILLFQSQDLVTNRRLLEMSEPSADLSAEEWKEIRRLDLERLNWMASYAEGTGCLRNQILKYFGGKDNLAPCMNCSNCQKEFKTIDIQTEAKMILSCVFKTGQRYGADFIAHVLKGKKRGDYKYQNVEQQSTWGLMSDRTMKEIRRMIAELVNLGYLGYSSQSPYAALVLTEKSRKALFESNPILIREMQGTERRGKKLKAEYQEAPHSLSYDEKLFQLLRARRNKIAEDEQVPPFVILDNKTLEAIAATRPHTEEDFMGIYGIGKIKTQRYAADFLAVVQAYENEAD